MDVVKDNPRDRAAENTGDWYSDQNQRNRMRPFALPKPVGEIEHDAGIVAGLGKAEKKARDIQLMHIADEAREQGHKTPGDKNACDPDAGADPMQQQIAAELQTECNRRRTFPLGARTAGC